MTTSPCAICGNTAVEQLRDRQIVADGRSIAVTGLRHYVCENCSADFVDEAQSRYNLGKIRLARGQDPGFLFPETIREWRESIGLTQKLAARLFGGGVNAFSKYETGEITPVGAMDNLMWVAMRFPGVVPELAKRRGCELVDSVRDRCGCLFQWSGPAPLDPIQVSFIGAESFSIHSTPFVNDAEWEQAA